MKVAIENLCKKASSNIAEEEKRKAQGEKELVLA